MDTLFLSVLLGLFHGLDPGKGWLFGVYTYLYTKSRARAASAIVAAWTGHSIAVLATAVGALALLREASAAASMALALIMVAIGLAAFFKHFNWLRPWSGARDVLAFSALAGAAHGAGLPLAYLCGASPLAILLAHIYATLAAMSASAAAFSKALAHLKRWWINYDALWGAVLIATGVAQLAWRILL